MKENPAGETRQVRSSSGTEKRTDSGTEKRTGPRAPVTRRLRFESFLLELATAFAQVETDAVDREINTWLGRLTPLTGVDRCGLWEVTNDGAHVYCRHFSTSPGREPPPIATLPRARLPWLAEQYARGQVVAWQRIPDDIPPEAVSERKFMSLIGLKSLLAIPILAGPPVCVMSFAWRTQPPLLSTKLISRLRLVGEIFASAIRRHRAERSLRTSESRFRDAFDHSATGIALVSPQGNWLKVNNALHRILGYSEAELLATTFQALTVPEDIAPNLASVERALAGEINHYQLEKRYIAKGGRIVWALLTVSAVRDETGRLLYFVSQVQDLTQQKQSQLEIERMRRELTHVGRLALVGQLTASLAHEVLQPITCVVSNARSGLRQWESPQAENLEMRPILLDIVESAERAAGIVHHVRDLLRKEHRARRPVNLNDIVQQVSEVLRSELMLRRVRLAIRLDSAVPPITAEPIELQQVVLNLVLNAAEAMDGGVYREPVEVTTAASATEIALSVRDWGRGVHPANLRRIFEPFFTTKPNGIGVGLSICAEIVRSHGGRLWAENNSGPGLTLHCVLPIAQPLLEESNVETLSASL